MNTWTGLTPMARIEVVIDGEHVPTVRDLLLAAGATGYTALPVSPALVTAANTKDACCSTTATACRC